jgi:adenylosuccinate synthase
MPITVIVGTQWGDEGKGRITDLLAADAHISARYNGGDNAGHTVTVGDAIFKLHLLPSGLLHPGVTGVIGAGVVVNPRRLLEEIEQLAAQGIEVSPARLKLSEAAHLILPTHIALDRAASGALGTTQRGIGPAYADKAARTGVRAGEMADPEAFAERVHAAVQQSAQVLQRVYQQPAPDASAVAAEYYSYAQRLAPYVSDTSLYIYEALQAGKRVVAEGAQGVLLDLDHGTYPFVTSSTTTAGGVTSGLGVGPQWIERIVGVCKAFQTRVGSGPMPTELSGAEGERLRGTGEQPWDEFGTTTGRPRRCGWLDGVSLRYAVRVNGLTELALTKLDILSGLPQVRIAVAYELDGERLEHFPTMATTLAACRPIYEEFTGWGEDVRRARRLADLPAAARRYVDRVAEIAGVPATIISVGPERQQSVVSSQ